LDKISVVCPAYDSARYLEENLKIIRNLSLKYLVDLEIVVVDTGSSDGTIDIAKKWADRVIAAPKATRGAARNVGAKIAKNQMLAFLDSDCEVTENWILRVLNLPDNLGSNVLGGPVMLDIPKASIEKAMRNLLLDPLLTLKSSSFSMIRATKGVKELSGANILVSKSFFEKIGGFSDVDFNEDTLFCRKVRGQDGTITYDLELRVIHKHQFSGVKSFAAYFFKYGKGYGKTFKSYPFLLRRYALVAFLSPVVLVLLFWLVLANSMELFLLLIILAFFVGTLLYSLAKSRKPYGIWIPLLFFLLSTSYIGGFYYGVLKS
jgi:glycosyltransferase involved in cell wall biosynthesis